MTSDVFVNVLAMRAGDETKKKKKKSLKSLIIHSANVHNGEVT